jgi:hypothetical protein
MLLTRELDLIQNMYGDVAAGIVRAFYQAYSRGVRMHVVQVSKVSGRIPVVI